MWLTVGLIDKLTLDGQKKKYRAIFANFSRDHAIDIFFI